MLYWIAVYLYKSLLLLREIVEMALISFRLL